MKQERSPYWFKAKRYGYGWGLPLRWEGWAVLIGWLVIMIAGSILIPLLMINYLKLPIGAGIFSISVFALVMAGVLIGVCYAKGEPAKWRWGDEK
jgi:hypothetical protein